MSEDKASDSDGDGTSDFAELQQYFKAVNAHIGQTPSGAAILCADVALAFNDAASDEDPADKGCISIDQLHPNDLGHKVMPTSCGNSGTGPFPLPATRP